MDAIQENIWWTIKQATMLGDDAKHKPAEERSGYYKAAFLFAASAIEALAYLIVKNFCSKNKEAVYPTEISFNLLHTFPDDLFNNKDGPVGIYEKSAKQILWKDGIAFHKLNKIISDNAICNEKIYANLEKVREQRNRIHIQSLEQTDHQYTEKDVSDAQSLIANLLPLV